MAQRVGRAPRPPCESRRRGRLWCAGEGARATGGKTKRGGRSPLGNDRQVRTQRARFSTSGIAWSSVSPLATASVWSGLHPWSPYVTYSTVPLLTR